MKKKKRSYLLWGLLLIGAVAILYCYNYYLTFLKPNSSEESRPVLIYSQSDYSTALDSIKSSGAVADWNRFQKAARKMELERSFKPGRYIIGKGLSNKAIVRIIANGWQKPMNLQLRGYIRSLDLLASYLSKRLEADSTEFASAFHDKLIQESLGFDEKSMIGMFLPDTYELYWTVTPEDFLRRMKREYDSFWNDERLKKATEAGLSQQEVMTLASIVIEETKYEPEMARVAGVYINRLNKGMLLQADPTVKFALNQAGVKRILNEHLKVDSPYNTYIYKGLPPGPITIAPKSAIDAVLNYEHHDYLYFCAKESFNGQHNFAKNYGEHMKNARAYQRALTARESARRK